MAAVLLTPILLVAGFGATSFLAEQETLRGLLDNQIIGEAWAQGWRLIPYAFNVLALLVVYTVMPNRRPDFRSLLIAAVAAGVVWQFVQIAYVQLQFGVARANLIYGALAQLPVTLLWLYVSWTIILAGAELAALLEFGLEVDRAEREGAEPSRWEIALQVLHEAARKFSEGTGVLEPRSFSHAHEIDEGVVAEVCQRLEAKGFLREVASRRAAYTLARDPSGVGLASVCALFDPPRGSVRWDHSVAGLLARLGAQREGELGGMSLADLLEGNQHVSEEYSEA